MTLDHAGWRLYDHNDICKTLCQTAQLIKLPGQAISTSLNVAIISHVEEDELVECDLHKVRKVTTFYLDHCGAHIMPAALHNIESAKRLNHIGWLAEGFSQAPANSGLYAL